MNSPLVLIARRLPRELVHIIQTYIRNDVVHEAVRHHLHYLMYEQEIYMRFVYYNYIKPLCTCHQHGPKYLRKYGGCQQCTLFESIQYSDSEYKVAGYVTCLGDDNPQQYKLLQND
jgi:hypothetical protein